MSRMNNFIPSRTFNSNGYYFIQVNNNIWKINWEYDVNGDYEIQLEFNNQQLIVSNRINNSNVEKIYDMDENVENLSIGFPFAKYLSETFLPLLDKGRFGIWVGNSIDPIYYQN
ncbi:MAG: hypothetical protein K0R54_55 [Clostridiaceae bacterium]|jgi:hypothetical protein|nr:hypothetical protein [Clostridiaceae bacterium]